MFCDVSEVYEFHIPSSHHWLSRSTSLLVVWCAVAGDTGGGFGGGGGAGGGYNDNNNNNNSVTVADERQATKCTCTVLYCGFCVTLQPVSIETNRLLLCLT